MTRLLIRRLLSAIPVLFGLLTITFFVIRLAPGDPSALYQDPSIDPQAIDALLEQMGLEEPLPAQYGKWLGIIPPFRGVFQGEWGMSFSRRQPVFEVIAETVPNTLLLTLTALLIDLLLGMTAGILAAINRNRWIDHVVRSAGLFFYSMPHFYFAVMLVLVFSLGLGWLPATQMHSVNADLMTNFEYFFDALRHLILPALALGIPAGASTARYLRNHLLETLQQDYIRTARAKGLTEPAVIFRHALPNALLPMITLLGLAERSGDR